MIWLVGNRGMLGAEVEDLLRARGAAYLASDMDVDITRPDALEEFLSSRGAGSLAWIINCSGYTAVDAAEDEPDRAFAVNERGVRNLANAACRTGAALLHLSTDYVFDGTGEGAYAEDDPPNPVSVYGKSKLAGEIALKQLLERHLIVRTAWLYGRRGKNFVATMLRIFRERGRVTVVDDQWGSPTCAPDLARAILDIVERRVIPYGIYHYTNEGRTNWYEFAAEIYRQAREHGLARPGVELVPVGSAEYPTRARRPRNSFLSKEKIRNTFGVAIRDWRDALRSYFDEGAAS
jgi:dTDP-4-dehydrorhamnose reductase